MKNIALASGMQVYADTGILCGHFDTALCKSYVVPPTAPCFQQQPQGEAFVPFINDGVIAWRRYMPRGDTNEYIGFRKWILEMAKDTVLKSKQSLLKGTTEE
jgi:hypothetical protein